MKRCFSYGGLLCNCWEKVACTSNINPKIKIGMVKLLVSGFIFMLFSANAATWFVDSNTTGGANNGTSWANAWTSISSATGGSVSAGDTVYISGGSTGNSQTYSAFTPKAGSAGKPITYQIGQDLLHNGTAIFSGSGTWLNNPAYCIVSGDAGDGAMHFSLAGYSMILYTSSSGAVSYRLSYINFGTINNPSDYGRIIHCTTGSDVEIDHCYMKNGTTASTSDIAVYWAAGGVAAYDAGFRFHHNVLLTPQTGQGIGTDGLRIDGAMGVSIYNNYVCGYASTGPAEHADGIQDWTTGSYIKIYNNIFQDINNAGINISAYYGGYSHVRMYNNFIVFTSSTSSSGSEGGFVGLAASGFTMTDCIVANNLISGGSQGWSMNNSGGYSVNWTGCYIANNISVQGAVVQADTAHGVISLANVDNLSASTAAGYFKNYVNSLNGTNNNFQLKSTATPLIGKGTNLTAFGITTDFAGNPRPSSGMWDIGPYQFSSGSITNPIISTSIANLGFGSVSLGASVTNSFTVQNVGAGTLSGIASVAAPFSIVSGGTYSLGSNQTQVVLVRFTPVVAGSASQQVSLTGGNGASLTVTGSGLSTNLLPSVSAISMNASDVAPSTSGLQIYGGTVVQLSVASTNVSIYQWSYTVNGGSSIIYKAGSGVVAPTSFTYDQSTIGNTYVWTLTVSNGQSSAQAQLTLSVVAPPAVTPSLVFNAQSGSFGSNGVSFVLGSSVVSGITNYYIYQTTETTVVTNGGSATYFFNITNAGNYVIQAKVNASTSGANSLFVNIDGQPQDPSMIWDVTLTSGFEQRLVSWRGNGTDVADQFVPAVFNLTNGPHQIIFRGREANTQLSSFSILQLPQPPTGLHVM